MYLSHRPIAPRRSRPDLARGLLGDLVGTKKAVQALRYWITVPALGGSHFSLVVISACQVCVCWLVSKFLRMVSLTKLLWLKQNALHPLHAVVYHACATMQRFSGRAFLSSPFA